MIDENNCLNLKIKNTSFIDKIIAGFDFEILDKNDFHFIKYIRETRK